MIIWFTISKTIHTRFISLPTNMDMQRQINMCFFISIIFVTIQIKFEIDMDINTNDDELLKIISERKRGKKKKSWLSLIVVWSITEPK